MGWLKPVLAKAIWPRMWYSPLHLLCSRTSSSRNCRHSAPMSSSPLMVGREGHYVPFKKWWSLFAGDWNLQIFGGLRFNFTNIEMTHWYPDWWISYALRYHPKKSMGSPSVFLVILFNVVVHGGLGEEVNSLEHHGSPPKQCLPDFFPPHAPWFFWTTTCFFLINSLLINSPPALRKNLLPEFRQSSLNVFDASRFKRTAVVMLGTPQLENLRVAKLPKLKLWGGNLGQVVRVGIWRWKVGVSIGKLKLRKNQLNHSLYIYIRYRYLI